MRHLPAMGKYLFSVSMFLVGAVALVLPSGYSLGFALLCFSSLALWAFNRESLLVKETHFFFWPILAYAIGHASLALNEKWAAREFNTYLPFVMVLFGVWGVRRYKPNANWFWVGLALGAIGAAFFAGFQAIVLGARASGFSNAIQFGNIALLLGVLCMVRALAVTGVNWLNALLWAGFVAGLAASVWSQTRGGWVAVVLIFIWVLLHTTRGWAPLKRGLAALILFCFLAIPAMQPNGVVQSRVNEAVTESYAFFENGKQDSSVGARLAMWSVALDAISHAAVLGHGNQGWIEVRDQAIADGRLSSFSSGFTHLHNEYLNVAFKRGFVGLALYLALYLVPMLMFFKPYLHDARADVRSFAMAGMVIPMMFMDFGLTQTFLSHNSGRVVLCSLWMCVAALMLNATLCQKEKSDV
jgi:O-antigen ligase